MTPGTWPTLATGGPFARSLIQLALIVTTTNKELKEMITTKRSEPWPTVWSGSSTAASAEAEAAHHALKRRCQWPNIRRHCDESTKRLPSTRATYYCGRAPLLPSSPLRAS
jgi:hypothetical protein